MIAFYVQGGGLGHLTRTHALIQQLQIDPKAVLIITPSAFNHYFKQYVFVSISWNDSPAAWSNTVIQVLTTHGISECYIDAFPLGIKGELIAVYKAFPRVSFLYACRILKWNRYLKAMPETFTPFFDKTFVLEKIYDAHLEWVHSSTTQTEVMQLPVHFPKEHRRLHKGPYVLVVHSGGKEDVIALCRKVKFDVGDTTLPIYVFTQVSVVFDDERFQFRMKAYPVHQYFQYAARIYTAAGFNLMNELRPYQEKHRVFPLDRLYDDQFFRSKHRPAFLTE